jgi:hypothetical protein
MTPPGRIVWNEPARILEAGRHARPWNGKDRSGARAAPGVYFQSARVDGIPSVRRLVLVR